MLNFKNTNIAFIIIAVIIAGLATRYPVPLYVYLLTAFMYSLFLFYGSYYVGSNFFMKVLCSADTAAMQIAISFDDGPATAHTPEILEVLRSNKVPAHFSVLVKILPAMRYCCNR